MGVFRVEGIMHADDTQDLVVPAFSYESEGHVM